MSVAQSDPQQASASAAPPTRGNPCTPCCGVPSPEPESTVERLNIRLQADQPIVPVPVYQEIYKRDKFIEIPQVEVRDTIIPRVYNQAAVHEIPRLDVAFQENSVELKATKETEREVEVPVLVGYSPQFVPKWDVREVPRPVPKYEGEQQVIEVEVPQIEYKDVYVEKEVIVDVKETVIPKVTEVVKEVEVMKYEWKERQQDVPVYKYVPKFDVELDCPPAMIVPYPELRIVKDPPQTTNPYSGPFEACCSPSRANQGAGASFRRGPSGVYLKQPSSTAWPPNGGLHGGTQPPLIAAGGIFHSTVPTVHPRVEQLPAAAGGSPVLSVSDQVTEQRLPQGLTVHGPLQGTSPTTSPLPVHLSPGPIFPMPSPQVDAKPGPLPTGDAGARGGMDSKAKKPEERKNLWSWLFGKKEETRPISPRAGSPQALSYPKGTPADFTAHFQQQMQQSQASTDKLDAHSEGALPPSSRSDEEQSELEPSVTYRGAVSMPAEYGGELNPISFKLHAVEIHQFVPLPNMRVPEFVKALPDGITTADVSGLDKFFGPVPTGWADPDVTGIPAPMMSDIIAGNVKATTTSPLINQLSHQFAKQESTMHDVGTELFTQDPSSATEAPHAAVPQVSDAPDVGVAGWAHPHHEQLREAQEAHQTAA